MKFSLYIDLPVKEEDLVDGVMTMYQNIFFPILRLVQSILSTLGGGNR